jgi:hypothetical protein
MDQHNGEPINVWTLAGFAYVSLVIDVCSRRTLGRHESRRPGAPRLGRAQQRRLMHRHSSRLRGKDA